MNKTRVLNKKTNLISCRTCQGKISRNAETCPHCGDSSPLPANEYLKSGLLKIVLAIVGAFILYNVAHSILGNMQNNLTKQIRQK